MQHCVVMGKLFLKRQILHSSKLDEFADNNFKFDEIGIMFAKSVENTVGKGEIACYKQLCHLVKS